MVFEFCSTSKVSFPGSGIAAIASSEANIADIKKRLTIQTIGHDKINQLRHVKFLRMLMASRHIWKTGRSDSSEI